MIRVGLTGTLGAGKSTVGRLFERWGAFRVDADRLAREAVEPGSGALERIRRTWGDRVLDAEGVLDRGALRRLVTRDPEARRRLERIVHPEVARLRAERRREAEDRGVEVFVEEVPLLFEVGLEEEFDRVVVVDAPEETRRRRVSRGREIDAAEFEAMDAAQMTGAEKRARADHVIWNDGDRASLERKARKVWERIRGEGGGDAWEVDLHAHTRASYDCLSEPADVVRTARERGLDRIAVTDHDEIEGAWEARDLAPELVIVGEEVRTAEGLDLIGLFLEERLAPGAPLAEAADAIRAQGGVVYLPHPFDPRRGGEEALFDGLADRIDLVEGLNARVHEPETNRRAVTWAARHDLPLGAGSDAHLLSEIGRARVILPPFDDGPGLVEAAGRGRIVGEASGRWVHLGSTWAKLRKRLPL